jgi:hypothetical protein
MVRLTLEFYLLTIRFPNGIFIIGVSSRFLALSMGELLREFRPLKLNGEPSGEESDTLAECIYDCLSWSNVKY